jgi:hypothetical protein
MGSGTSFRWRAAAPCSSPGPEQRDATESRAWDHDAVPDDPHEAPWRVVLITVLPAVATGYAQIVRALGHEPVAVIVPRRRTPMPSAHRAFTAAGARRAFNRGVPALAGAACLFGAQAFGIGLVHGLAGSAGVAILIVAAVPNRTMAVAALLVMVVGTAVSMSVLSAAIGRAAALLAL